MGMNIRELAATDRQAIEGILAESGAFSPEERAVALELVSESLQEGATGDYPHFVAEMDNEPAAYICLGRTPMTKSTWHLYWICVRPARQRCGIGRMLHDFAEQFVRARFGQRIVLETSGRPDYAGSRQFYLAIGYRPAGEIRDYYGPGDSCLYYCKEL
jgi:ribosomal protein S18 acetylase RimI-like enzyme